MIEVHEKPKMVERAYLVGIRQAGESEEETRQLLRELEALVRTLSIDVVGTEVVNLRDYQVRFLVGAGKAEAIIENARSLTADCLVFDAELSPSQQRNWENLSKWCVIDRQEVILDIFHERARTR